MINHIQNISLEEAHNRLQQVQSSIEKIEKYVPQLGNQNEEALHGIDPLQASSKVKATLPIAKKKEDQKKDTERVPQMMAQRQFNYKNCNRISDQWAILIEELQNIQSYQIILSPLKENNNKQMVLDLEVAVETNRMDKSKLIVGNVLSWIVPGLVENYQSSKHNDYISIRLQMKTSEFQNDNNYKVSSSIENLECYFCGSNLLIKSIDRIIPLPSGHWEEITDYLLCYPGQPVVDFGKTSVPIRAAWEDVSVWVLHPEDIEAVSVLESVEPYGTFVSQDSQSSFSWLPAPVGNEDDQDIQTICCNYCCAPLGIATQQGYHVYKHRLSNDELSLSVSKFVAFQLKRYAESQAVYTFIVVPGHGLKSNEECLLLHILSWDTCRYDLTTGYRIPIVKLIYQRLSQLPLLHFDEAADLTSWTWGGLDLCCVPGVGASNNRSKAKSVTLTLDSSEWESLEAQLSASSRLFPKDIVDATVLVKLGRDVSVSEDVGLTTLDLH